jgi:MFS family permease
MQSVAAAWLMTSLTTSPVPVALLTTMGSLPIFLVGLPAGALADVVDRRWLVLMTQVWMLIVAAVLSGLTAMSWMSPTLLLALTFTLALGGALSARHGRPSSRSLFPDGSLPPPWRSTARASILRAPLAPRLVACWSPRLARQPCLS